MIHTYYQVHVYSYSIHVLYVFFKIAQHNVFINQHSQQN